MALYRHKEKTICYEKERKEMKVVEKIEEKISISDEMVAKRILFILLRQQERRGCDIILV